MDLRDKLGQQFVYRLPYVKGLTAEVADFLVECRAGGVVLFGFNVETPAQIAEFNRDLQNLARQNGLPPFIISLDEEGGQVSRMPALGQDLISPSQMAQAVVGPEAVRACADVTGRRLRNLGFNLNFAPVLDINNNPANPAIGPRSFSEKPELVAQMGAIAIEAYLNTGVSPCAKHFPGHGDTNVDSHYGLPIVHKTLAQLEEVELLPFRRAIAAGVPAIMTAHIVYPPIEPSGLPATLSPFFLRELLRGQMGFEGLIFTDALDMLAIADRYGTSRAAILALQAGADVVMPLAMSLERQQLVFEEVLAAASAGELDLTALDESRARLERWRTIFCLPATENEPTAEDYATIAQIARRGLTVVQARPERLPTSPTLPLLVDFTLEMASPVEEGRRPGPLLEAQLRRSLPSLLRLEVGAFPTDADTVRVMDWASQSDLIIIVTRKARQISAQATLIARLLAGPAPVIAIAAREPYDTTLLTDASVVIATYGDPPATIKALATRLEEILGITGLTED